MKAIVQLYLTKILNGEITIDDVPNKLKAEVQAELDALQNNE